eukprot:TRINITY_DN7405_c0_g1_i1.p1 TRINITY_DN7405_c0_g1~~TRINITY_DN7405_c0_g1_i1.p1  ORF type:complete len:335 (-),score=47.22 TRINITY_DN7405_c0_g1_i1:24-1028(-)
MEEIWDHTFRYCLRIDPKEHPILLSEPSFNTGFCRERTTEIMFEKYEAPALFISKNAVLTSFACGRATSLVLDSGGGMTCAVPVHDGFALTKGIVKSSLAGNRLTDIYYRILQEEQIRIQPSFTITKKEIKPGQFQISVKEFPGTTSSFYEFSVKKVINDLKETACRVSENPYDEENLGNVATIPYELPDGSSIEVGRDRFKIPELMFNPKLIQDKHLSEYHGLYRKGVHEMVYESIFACDGDLKRELFNNVIVTGGNSLFKGFPERLQKELVTLAPSQMAKFKPIVPPSSPERRFSVWIGGSILASLGSFHQMWISKQEYEEQGRTVVERKCP